MKIILLDEKLELEKDELVERLLSKYPEVDLVYLNEENKAILENIDYWNSILIYRFVEEKMSSINKQLIEQYIETTKGKGSIFPVAYGSFPVPPEPIKKLKANSIAGTNALNNIVNRVGSFLGLTCLGKDHTIFVSYRAVDGRGHAEKIAEALEQAGFKVWRDEAKDQDSEGNIKIGTNAQEEIEENLKRCSAMILIDTALVAESPWIKREIDVANSELIPILPVCFRRSGDFDKGPRFKVLKDLNRWFDVNEDTIDFEAIINYLSVFLLDIYTRKRTMPGILEKAFLKKGFNWKILDSKKLYFSSSKDLNFFVKTILSHSPIHRGLYPPYIRNFSEFNDKNQNFNHRILIYDGDPMNESEVHNLKKQIGVYNVDILHHQKIELMLEVL